MSSESKIVDLGEWAEDVFSSMCAKAGVTRNKSQQDRTGWDYFVEFSPEKNHEQPADLQPVETAARVQVKSKRSGTPTVTLRLSNALRFAKDPLPCFIVLFLATNGSEPVRVFARHFGEEEINATLRRVRETENAPHSDLNRLSISFSFKPCHEVGDKLMSWMREIMWSKGDGYSEWKCMFSRNAGSPTLGGSISFKVSDLQTFIDHQIGLSPKAPPLNIAISHNRFGIAAKNPLFHGTPTVASIQAHPQPCRIKVRGKSGEIIWINGQLYMPIFPDVPLEYFKARVVAEFIEVVVDATSGNVTFHLEGHIQRSLQELRTLVDVLLVAEAGPIHIQFSNGTGMGKSFSVSMLSEYTYDELCQLSNVVACFEKVAVAIAPNDFSLSLTDIDKAWNSIVEFNGLVNGTDVKGTFNLDREIPPDLAPVHAIFSYGYVDVGHWTVMAVVRRPITAFVVEGKSGKISFGDARVVDAIISRGTGAHRLGELRELYAAACRMEGDGVLEMYDGDYKAMVCSAVGAPMRRLGPDGPAVTA